MELRTIVHVCAIELSIDLGIRVSLFDKERVIKKGNYIVQQGRQAISA